MVRLRKLLDQGSEVTFLPGDGSVENRTYEVHVITVDGNGITEVGPTPQSALLSVSRMRPDGTQVTYAMAAGGGWFADLRDVSGRSTATGYGRSQAAALAQLLERRGLVEAPAVPPLVWMKSEDGTRWTAQLADGRTAVIERLDDDESFLPRIGESTGPVCDGLLAAAQWAEHHLEASR